MTKGSHGKERIGIFGGMFNPPHLGHLICAQEAHAQLGLSRVVFMPVGIAPHKEVDDEVGGPEIRLAMCGLATQSDERFEISRHEVDKPAPAYTHETLAELLTAWSGEPVSADADPAEGDSGWELVFLMGGDQALQLPDWRKPEEVLRLAEVAVAEREAGRRRDIERRLAGLRGSERTRFFEMPRIDISSSMIRARAREGRPIRYLVPRRVGQLIENEGLYRG